MKVINSIFLFIGLLPMLLMGQNDDWLENKKGDFYFYWSYNSSYYSKTNLHFNGPEYDFTLYNLTGHDRPTKFGWVYFNPATLTIPQYNARFGYFISNRFALSFGIDHLKYVVDAYQETTISGIVTESASPHYTGSYLNEPISLDPSLLSFEHTDGFNLASLEIEYLYPFPWKLGKNFSLKINTGLGGIWVVTKTNVKIFGEGLDNDFHIAGYTLVAKIGPRLEFKDKIFLLAEIKGGYASLPSVLVKNAAPEVGDHNLVFFEYYVAVGMNFSLFKKRKAKKALRKASRLDNE